MNKTIVISAEYLIKGNLEESAIEDIIYIEVEERYCNIINRKEKFVIMMSQLKC
jgi:DNA-binding LytR/AlgR family response regulator